MPTNFSPATANYFATKTRIRARVLFWVRAINRETGAPETMGLWNGDDHRDFVIGGETRTYYAAGSLLSIDPITSQIGLKVRQHRVVLSPLAPEVQQLIRGYEPRFAPVEIHRALFDPDSHALIDEPHRRFKGYIDKIAFKTGPKGEKVTVELTLASAARALTVPLSRKRSDETLRARSPNDGFRRYADVAGTITVKWGQK
ncbi:hypothetical protein D2T29_22490 [Sinirhodobacter populi]|uniref:DUF2163 domain-containing protein n=1 Tax=Paenirhodobacter populi TaxID=2306993 RepID=A0A443JWP9_9RHOB|nr:hypothetical protein [Sinirhodobacter populi]RWR24937.1 hypothetical protein D2T29_22490 [Sinirhodobacter populi]